MSDLIIDVRFYDDKEENEFKKNYPSWHKKIVEIFGAEFTIPFEDFRILSQLHHLNPGLGLNSRVLRDLVESNWGPVGTYTHFDPKNGKFNSNWGTNNEQTYVSKSIGTGGILSVANALFKTTDADWQRINVSNHKDFDFLSAVDSDETTLVVTEAKGSIVDDNNYKYGISGYKSEIKAKKLDENFKSKYAQGVDMIFGGITVADPNNHLKLWLVDPPMESTLSFEQRRRIKLLKRLNYYYRFLGNISWRSTITTVLKNRIRVLENVSDISQLNGLALTNSRGEFLYASISFLENHSHIGDDIVGTIYFLDSDRAIFIGLPIQVINLLVYQNFDEILKLKFRSYTYTSVVHGKVNPRNPMTKKFVGKEAKWFTSRPINIYQVASGLTFSLIKSTDINHNND